MKKIKGIIIFCIIFLIILLIDFTLYKNINVFLLNEEGKIYTLADNSNKVQKDFSSEMFEMMYLENNFNQITDYEEIKNDEVLYNLIIKSKDEYFPEEDMFSDSYISESLDTVYGRLRAININTNQLFGEDILIVYSEDTKKIYYLNFDKQSEMFSKLDDRIDIGQMNNYKNEQEKLETSDVLTTDEISVTRRIRKELVRKVKEAFSNLMKNYKFEPDSIIYSGYYYVLKDNVEDITICYDANNDNIFAFYIGFNK